MTRIPPLDEWNTYSGGVGAAPGARSYDLRTPLGQYFIDPVTWPDGRHRGYIAQVANIHGVLGGGLYHRIECDRTGATARGLGARVFNLRAALRACRAHYAANSTRMLSCI